MRMLSRTSRLALVAAASVSLSGCLTHESLTEDAFAPDLTQTAALEPQAAESAFGANVPPDSALNYAAIDDNGFHLVDIPVDKVDPRFLRQQVPYDAGGYEVGTVIVDTPNRFLYVIEPNGMAMRYGVAVGGSGLSWKGEAKVGTKREWPSWHPPAEMIKRKPELEPYKNGMPAGLTNPLGARALYLYAEGRDTLYRLHGTAEWWTIGTAASSGCIRLMNQDAIDLYNRVAVGTKVVVLQGNEALVGEDANAVPPPPPQFVAGASGSTGMGAPMESNALVASNQGYPPAGGQTYGAAPQPYGAAAPAAGAGQPQGYGAMPTASGAAPGYDPYATGSAGYDAYGQPVIDPYAVPAQTQF